MQVNAALHDHQTESRAGTVPDVLSAMEGVEEPFSVSFWNADTLVTNNTNKFCSDAIDIEPHERPA